ncbi:MULTISPECIES: ABC transporter permease [Acidiphilium]|uniref:ABC transporter permease n=1 Tax=Acidiphilium iwatense TaxID=768198 RepID=A0ABS9DR24_9PROT|nr:MULTISPECIES: ABC transporter permease [Acidiphilium]MCF3945203.1 ABC transporter permease [Acidiphilium iwatense]
MSNSLSQSLAAPGGMLRRSAIERASIWIGDRGTLIAGIALSVFVLGFSLVGGLLYHASPYAVHGHHALQPPSAAFPFGTDQIGRNELARLISGGYATLIVSIPAAILTFMLGIVYGLAAALGPSWFDKVLMRLLDAILALPTLVVLIFFAALVPLNDFSLVVLLGVTSWPGLARLVRNEAIAQRGRDFVLATRQFGGGTWYVARVHILRVMAPILVVNATFLIGDSVLALSALSFLGLGVQPPHTSWGGLLQTGLNLIALNPWWMILPSGAMIFLAIMAANLLGQGLLARFGAAR